MRTYLRLLTYIRLSSRTWWSEGLIVALAFVGFIAALATRPDHNPRAHLYRFLAFYAVLTTAFYSIIPYKTPWCLLTFHHALILLAGIGAVALVRVVRFWPLRTLVTLLLLAAAYQLARQAYRANYEMFADPRNPYVYAHTVIALRHLPERAEQLAKVHPDRRNMPIHVIKPDADY